MGEAPLNHPTDEELHALSLGQLAEAGLARTLAHLGDCPSCCRRLDQWADDDPLLSRLLNGFFARLPGPLRRLVERRRNLAVLALNAFVAAALLMAPLLGAPAAPIAEHSLSKLDDR